MHFVPAISRAFVLFFFTLSMGCWPKELKFVPVHVHAAFNPDPTHTHTNTHLSTPVKLIVFCHCFTDWCLQSIMENEELLKLPVT
jgi:hypothetical protein